MTLDHVDQSAGVVVVAGATLESQVLVEGDLDLLDVLGVPNRFEDAVGEPQSEEVQHRGFAQEVVDAVNLFFWHKPDEAPVQCLRSAQVGTEWLLERKHGARGQFDLRECGTGGDGHRWRQREVEGGDTGALRQNPPQVVGLRHIRLEVGRGLDDTRDPGTLRTARGE